MALTFGAAPSDRVQCNGGAGTGLDDLTACTLACWVRLSSIPGSNRKFMEKNNGGTGFNLLRLNATSGTVSMAQDWSGTDPFATTSGGLSTGVWYFLAATFDGANTPKIWLGTRSADATEQALGSSAAPAGSRVSESSSAQAVGNRTSADQAITGDMSWAGIFGRALSGDELRIQQYKPRIMSGTLLMYNLGENGLGTQIDLSGRGNHGTVTGATSGPGGEDSEYYQSVTANPFDISPEDWPLLGLATAAASSGAVRRLAGIGGLAGPNVGLAG